MNDIKQGFLLAVGAYAGWQVVRIIDLTVCKMHKDYKKKGQQ